MKTVVIGLVSFLVGGAGGYFLARRQYRKKLDKTIESINETQKAVQEKKEEKAEAESEEKQKDEDKDIDGHVDVYALAEEEKDESDEELYFDDYDTRSRIEFESKFEDYYGTNIPYPITQETYDDHDGTHTKRHIFIYTDEDKAYDQDTGEEVENFHTSIGDEEYDTLNEDNAVDFPGCWYIRNDAEGIDYEVEYSNRILDDM
jgi:hypothetical protein